MCNFFDDFDVEDLAFWGGFILTQLEGEQEGQQQEQEPRDDDPFGLNDDPLLDDQTEGTEDEDGW